MIGPFSPGISTLVPGGYVEPSGFLGVTITSPVLGSCSNSTVGVLRAGVVTSTGCDGFLLGSVTVPFPGTFPFGSLSFGTSPEPLSPIVTVIVVPFSPGISTLEPGGYVDPSGLLGVTVTSPVLGSCSTSSVGVSFSGGVTVTFTGTSSSDPSG